ncbi:hypothetical protein [Acidipropionibacterium virtanenii]|uniref:Uncharacterized protein n=1 Tax=Acidipropionibacterium virtanenii TaxID=2057246 RepID=A0A344UWB9_9ACTN|nr:hypothetical protein [Acidipropionibacterium virtanenii]AXE39567.1 hypothetical protein JS278_02428 [Acidipropionibacterium virtanenii]
MTATYAERLSAALARRGHAITPAEAAEAVREATGAITEPLSGVSGISSWPTAG